MIAGSFAMADRYGAYVQCQLDDVIYARGCPLLAARMAFADRLQQALHGTGLYDGL